MARSARRKSTPLSPAKSKQGITTPRRTRTSNRTVSREPGARVLKVQKQSKAALESVPEQGDTIEVNTSVAYGVDVQERSPASAELPSGFSDSDSDSDEMAKIDKDLITENLEFISQYSHKILRDLCSAPVAERRTDLIDSQSKLARLCRNNLQGLNISIEPCGRGPRVFLSVNRVLKALTGHEKSVAGIGSIFLRANLAIFASTIAAYEADSERVSELLQCLTVPDAFPQLFVEDREYAGAFAADFADQTLALGISIFTQAFIDYGVKTVSSGKSDAKELLQDLFFENKENVRNMSLGDASSGINHELKQAVQERVQQIMKFMPRSIGRPINIKGLREKYSWNSFLDEVFAWITVRERQFVQTIKEYGGAEGIKARLIAGTFDTLPQQTEKRKLTRAELEEEAADELTAFHIEEDDQLDAQHEASISESESASSAHSQSQDQAFVNNNEADDEQQQGRRVLQEIHLPTPRKHGSQDTIPESPQAHDQPQEPIEDAVFQHNAPIIEDVAEHEPLVEQEIPNLSQAPVDWAINPTQETLNVLRLTQIQAAESDKENSEAPQRYHLLDRQPTATRVTFDEDSQTQTQTQIQPHTKRRRNQDRDAEDEEEFETDTRQAKRPRPHTGKARAISHATGANEGSPVFFADGREPVEGTAFSQGSQRPPSTYQRPQEPSARPEASSARQRAVDPGSSRIAPSSGSRNQQQPSVDPPPASYEAYRNIKQNGQQNYRTASLVVTASSTRGSIRPPQIRKAWSGEEIERLLKLMQEYGTSWAKIKEMDSRDINPLLEGRNQVQLKDKARNMKFDYLKNEGPIPDFMTNVTINKSHIEELRRRGIGIPRDYGATDE